MPDRDMVPIRNLRSSRSTAMILILWAAVNCAAGCGRSRGAVPQDPSIDLGARFVAVSAGGADHFLAHLEVIRKGERKDAIKLAAPVTIRASLPEAAGKRILAFWGAPVFDTGDGFSMVVFIRRSGVRSMIENRYFDPGRKAEDRAWVPFAVPVEDIREGDQLEIEVGAGPQDDLTADWLALSSIRLQKR